MKKIVLLLALINLSACASLMEKDERMEPYQKLGLNILDNS